MRRSVPYPRINSYAEAGRVYNQTKPIRGTDFRPLGRRSRNNPTQILNQGGDFIIRLYSTDVVTYRLDGSVVLNTGGWHTQSTRQVIDEMSPFSCRSVRSTLVASCKEGSFQVNDKLEFDPEGKPVNPTPWVVHKRLVNKEKAKRVREYFKLVPQYIRTYQTAFAGGTVPDVDLDFEIYPYSGGELSDKQASRLAWRHIAYTGAQHRIIDIGEAAVKDFWVDQYERHDVHEVHTVTLPYGQVK